MLSKARKAYLRLRRKLEGRQISGESFPLYRLIIAAAVLSGTIQFVTWTVPGSIAQTGAWWTDWIFMTTQPIGGWIVAISMHMKPRTGLRLQVERVGNVILMFACTFYFFSVAANDGGIPKTFGTWCNLAVGLYLAVRILEDTAVEAKAARVQKSDGEAG